MLEGFDNLFESDDVEYPLRDKTFDFLIHLMKCRDQLRINHWQTTAYSEHKTTDKLIGDLTDYIDSIGETALGYFGRPQITSTANNITDIQLMPSQQIISTLEYITNEMLNLFKDTEYEGITALLGELISDIQKRKYLLTLK